MISDKEKVEYKKMNQHEIVSVIGSSEFYLLLTCILGNNISKINFVAPILLQKNFKLN